tara:strand:- start:4265 stop:5560 length:1296 start_codon:yes stop_codon:yes gene_type:complete
MATYYVSTSGSNSNSGADDAPFETLQHAIDQTSGGDDVRVYAGTYTESNIDPGAKNEIKIRSFGDGLVVINGTAGSGSINGNTIQPRNDWVIDGSTGSLLQNIEIIGGSESCVRGQGGSNRSFSLKHVILTGRGTGDLLNEGNSTKYAIKFPSTSTIRNILIRNFINGAVTYTGNPGPIYFRNNIIYKIGISSNSEAIVSHEDAANEIFFNTIVGCTGTIGIDTDGAVNPTIKNNLLAANKFAASGIRFRGVTNVLNNCVHSTLFSPSGGAYDDTASGSLDSSNLTSDPILNGTNPWDETFNSGVNGDFSVTPSVAPYDGSPRTTAGSPVEGAGVYLGATLTTDFSGSIRPRPPGIGALRVTPNILFTTAPTGDGLANKVQEDFIINHFNRISDETPRNVGQIPFSKAVLGPSNLKDRTTAYKLEKGKEGS